MILNFNPSLVVGLRYDYYCPVLPMRSDAGPVCIVHGGDGVQPNDVRQYPAFPGFVLAPTTSEASLASLGERNASTELAGAPRERRAEINTRVR